MDENKLKDIFNEYEPTLSSRMAFMERLERNLNAVEMIHRENANAIKRNRLAVIVASLAGFLVGLLFSFTLPYIYNIASGLKDSIPANSILSNLNLLFEFQNIIAWIIVGGLSVWASISTYNAMINFQPLISVKRED